jgi:mRNA-degrading endonuclease RelE of RelBE toxin-antitoxin system
MGESENTTTEFFSVEGVVIHLLKIWSQKENDEIGLSDVLYLPGYIDLVKSSKTLFDLIGKFVFGVLSGSHHVKDKEPSSWFIGMTNAFVFSVRGVDTETKVKVLKAIEILSTNPLVEGTVCMPLPHGTKGTWCYHDGDLKLVYGVDEKNKRLTLLKLIQVTTTKAAELHSQLLHAPGGPGDVVL